MQADEPAYLRSLATSYRARALTQPNKARVFIEIAKDMEMAALLIEGPFYKPAKRRLRL